MTDQTAHRARPKPPPPTPDVGFVGCSNTQRSVGGYFLVGGHRFWKGVNTYKGGTVLDWASQADTDVLWAGFDAYAAASPPALVWVQFCVHTFPAELADPDGNAAALLDRLRSRWDVPVYGSPINGYNPTSLNNEVAVERSRQLVDDLIAAGTILEGPAMVDLTASMVEQDGIHPDEAGQMAEGAALLGFFG